MKGPRRSRGIRKSCIEMSHMGLLKSSCRELLSGRSRDFRRSCIDIFYRDLVKRTYRELLSRGLLQRSCQGVQRYQEILYRDFS